MEIKEFRGEYYFLSNYSPLKNPILLEGIYYPTSEHAYQAYKTLDLEKRKGIANLNAPGESKKAGKNLDIRSDWEKIKLSVMEMVLKAKFSYNSDLLMKLLYTNDKILIEGNTWNDIFWGVNIQTGKGKNNLGKLLMKIRSQYKKIKVGNIEFIDFKGNFK